MSQDVPLIVSQAGLAQLNERSREIFRQIVESYLATGEPVGSRNLARIIPMTLSPASVRNVMADLEHAGLVYAPHTSAGRLPTERGLRFFVDALMQIGDLTENDRKAIEAQVAAAGTAKSVESVLNDASGHAVRTVPRGRRRAGGESPTRGSSTSNSCGSSPSAPWWCWSRRTGRSRTASSACRPGCRPRRCRRPPTSSMRASAAARWPRRASSSTARSRRARPSSISSPSASCRPALRAGRAARARSAS